MGCVSSGTVVDKEARKRTQEIEKQLKIDRERAAREVKMLMLGKLMYMYLCIKHRLLKLVNFKKTKNKKTFFIFDIIYFEKKAKNENKNHNII
jgi:hypothetical protein